MNPVKSGKAGLSSINLELKTAKILISDVFLYERHWSLALYLFWWLFYQHSQDKYVVKHVSLTPGFVFVRVLELGGHLTWSLGILISLDFAYLKCRILDWSPTWVADTIIFFVARGIKRDTAHSQA